MSGVFTHDWGASLTSLTYLRGVMRSPGAVLTSDLIGRYGYSCYPETWTGHSSAALLLRGQL